MSDASVLTALETARDALITAIAAGRMTVRYKVGNQEHWTESPSVALMNIEDLIDKYRRRSGQRMRVASIRGARNRGS
jgi:hypothetical protein